MGFVSIAALGRPNGVLVRSSRRCWTRLVPGRRCARRRPTTALRVRLATVPASGSTRAGTAKADSSSGDASRITPRSQNYAQWYLDVIAAAQLADTSPVKGALVIRPTGWAIWERLRDELDRRIKATGAQNACFPLFIPQSFLSREAEHVDGFAKECALVTHHRLRAVTAADGKSRLEPDPDARLEEALVVRPTSETLIWHMFGRWIQSYRDLPLLVNQWGNAVRWELRTRPFLRTSEFYWQEGHTAHATREEAMDKAREMLAVYRGVLEQWLAIPVVAGVKTASERFAGAEETFTVEAMMQNGWALQCGTSHFLGQNFARAFNVYYQTEEAGTRELVWATSWGASTRLLGALIMVHSDDTGLLLPPRVAPTQVVLVPILPKEEAERQQVRAFCESLLGRLRGHGLRVEMDGRETLRPGAKFFEWERRGVPLRLEVGKRDVANKGVTCARRVDGQKMALAVDGLEGRLEGMLEEVQEGMLERARRFVQQHWHRVEQYAEMRDRLRGRGAEEEDGEVGVNAGGFFLAPWRDSVENEARIKEECKATIRCYPDGWQQEARGKRCFYSGEMATHMALFARAY